MRADTMSDLRDERRVALSEFHKVRRAMEQRLNIEITRILQATEDMTQRRVRDFTQQAPRVIDHFMCDSGKWPRSVFCWCCPSWWQFCGYEDGPIGQRFKRF